LNIIEQLWSILDTRVRNRIPPSTSLNLLEEEWCKIPLPTVQNLYEFISRRIATVLEAKVDPKAY
jgi:hypothetical protein